MTKRRRARDTTMRMRGGKNKHSTTIHSGVLRLGFETLIRAHSRLFNPFSVRCAMGASSWLAVERPFKLAAPRTLARALQGNKLLLAILAGRVGNWPAEQMTRSRSEPLVHFAECMMRGRSRASCIVLHLVHLASNVTQAYQRASIAAVAAPSAKLALQ
jgi:hypothetical protein